MGFRGIPKAPRVEMEEEEEDEEEEDSVSVPGAADFIERWLAGVTCGFAASDDGFDDDDDVCPAPVAASALALALAAAPASALAPAPAPALAPAPGAVRSVRAAECAAPSGRKR